MRMCEVLEGDCAEGSLGHSGRLIARRSPGLATGYVWRCLRHERIGTRSATQSRGHCTWLVAVEQHLHAGMRLAGLSMSSNRRNAQETRGEWRSQFRGMICDKEDKNIVLGLGVQPPIFKIIFGKIVDNLFAITNYKQKIFVGSSPTFLYF